MFAKKYTLPGTPFEITRDQALEFIWRATHDDFRGKLEDGTRSVLLNSALTPLSALTDEQVTGQLPYAFKKAQESIKFQRYAVTNGVIKARVHYSLDNRTDKRKCVTIYAKDYGHDVGRLFAGNYKNDTDLSTDLFDKGKVTLFEDHPLYQTARAQVEQFNARRLKRKGEC